MIPSCSSSSWPRDSGTGGRVRFNWATVISSGTFGPDCVSGSSSGDRLRPSSCLGGGLGSFAISAGSGAGTGGTWLDDAFFALKVENVSM